MMRGTRMGMELSRSATELGGGQASLPGQPESMGMAREGDESRFGGLEAPRMLAGGPVKGRSKEKHRLGEQATEPNRNRHWEAWLPR